MANIPMIDSSDLRVFILTHERGSFRRTAAALGVEQSSISRRIRDLEDQLGATLFQRHSGGVELTFAGRRFLIHAQTILNELSESAREMADIGRSIEGGLRIFMTSSITPRVIVDLLSQYRRAHPRIHIDLIEGYSKDFSDEVLDLRVDVAFVHDPGHREGVEILELWREDLFLALPEGHRLVREPGIIWKDISDEVIILSGRSLGHDLNKYLAIQLNSFGAPPTYLPQIDQGGILALVAMGWGLSLVTEGGTMLRFPSVSYRRMSAAAVPFGAAWSSRNDNPALRQLLSLARKARKPAG